MRVRYFPAAAMSRTLKWISLLATLLTAAINYQAANTLPPIGAGQIAYALGMAIRLLLPAVVFFSLLLMVRGYRIDRTHLYVHRLIWKTKIPLQGFYKAEFAPDNLKGSRRLFGNGGFFAFTGLYQNNTLGRYRLFATDFSYAVTLFSTQKNIVITPAEPQMFVDYVQKCLRVNGNLQQNG